MPSSNSRLVLIQTALKQAGRGAELQSHCYILLNGLLRDLSMKNRYRVLRMVGANQTLSAGSCTAAFPSDMGNAVDAILFGPELLEILETDMKDFIRLYGFQPVTQMASRPYAYHVDTNARLLRFNAFADQAYSFFPVHWRIPADYSLDSTDDNTKIWYEADLAIIAGLMWLIYQYTDDAREQSQFQLFQKLDSDYRKGSAPTQSAAQRLQLSPGAFRGRVRR